MRSNLPDLQLVMMASSVNSSQHRGWVSSALDCKQVSNRKLQNEQLQGKEQNVNIRIPGEAWQFAHAALRHAQRCSLRRRRHRPIGLSWTGCGSLMCSLFPASARDWRSVRTRNPGGERKPIPVRQLSRVCVFGSRITYRFGPVKHADVEIPETQSAIFADTAETVVPVVAAPRVERYGRHPRLMALTARHNG